MSRLKSRVLELLNDDGGVAARDAASSNRTVAAQTNKGMRIDFLDMSFVTLRRAARTSPATGHGPGH
jgi:hypothetical protein